MRLRTLCAIMLVGSVLFLVRPARGGQETIPQDRSALSEHLGALKRDLLLLVSAGLGQAGMWKEASGVSRYLADTADEPFEICVAQAAVVWQMTEAFPLVDAIYGDWEKLRDTVDRIAVDDHSTAAQKAACQASYRRVAGNLIYQAMLTSDLGRGSLEKIRVVFAAYLGAVQQGVAADGGPRRR